MFNIPTSGMPGIGVQEVLVLHHFFKLTQSWQSISHSQSPLGWLPPLSRALSPPSLEGGVCRHEQGQVFQSQGEMVSSMCCSLSSLAATVGFWVLSWPCVSCAGVHCRVTTVMVNVMCQLDWSKRCPDSWSKIMSGCVC